MPTFFRTHLTTIVVAAVTAAVTAAGPPLAAAVFDAQNADKVDGRHAVGAGASISQRAGMLVATNASGRLPSNIISKAPDANLLDGLNSTVFLRTTGTAADAQKLDGKDSTAFLPSAGDLVVSDSRPWFSDTLTARIRVSDLGTAVQRPGSSMITAGAAYLPLTSPVAIMGQTVAFKSLEVCFNVYSLTINDITVTTRLHGASGLLGNTTVLAADETDRTANGCVTLSATAPTEVQATLPIVVAVSLKDINNDSDAIVLGRATATYGVS